MDGVRGGVGSGVGSGVGAQVERVTVEHSCNIAYRISAPIVLL